MTRPAKYLLLAFAIFSLGFSSNGWQKISEGLRDVNVKRIVMDPTRPELFWMITDRSVYEAKNINGRHTFKLLMPQVPSTINDIYDDHGVIYLATDDGLYMRGLKDYHFKRIYYSSDEAGRRCLAVTSFNGTLLLGTRKGLFLKEGASWEHLQGDLADATVNQITVRPTAVYVLNSQTVYRLELPQRSFAKIFTAGIGHEDSEDESLQDSDEFSEAADEMIDFTDAGAQTFYAGTRKGIFVTRDAGKNWERFPIDGLPYTYLRRILVDQDGGLFAATARGVYRYETGRWQQLYRGLETNDISDLAQDEQGHIYAAAARGLFVIRQSSLREDSKSNMPAIDSHQKIVFTDYAQIEEYFSFEPAVADVQAMAIEYAEVHPDKIKQWRKRAQISALAPSVSAGIDRSATEKFHWDTGANPDALIKGKDFLDWDVGVSWNLGELIWNNDQTSIDSRSKMMVELREDVLDQVTRIYFERRRIQIDLLGNATLDAMGKIEQQMRLAELTAIIDGYTGGRFSRRIQNNNERRDRT
jgi:hypothetical protein